MLVATQMLSARPDGGDIGDEHGIHDEHARTCAETISRAQQAMAGLQVAIAAATSGS